ncbi:MAG: outer membrane lipoprotein carrier protein LolA [Bacteroidetes bacterium]|nr:outer membrane lipoprotein carrier protein LolA [Bacteroidota bacterium]
MKRIVLLAITMIGISASSFAQTSDPAAKKVLDAVSAKFKSFKSVLANFTYKVENAVGKTLSTKKGSVTMKGSKYRINFGDQQIWCDGKTVWNYDKNSNEVTISKVESAAGTITPQKLFTNFYDKDFLYKLNGDKKEGSKTLQEIEMTPTDKSKAFHKVYVLVDKNAQTLYSTKVLETSGNRYDYTVNSLKPNVNADDSQFVFDKSKFPGVEEVNLQ